MAPTPAPKPVFLTDEQVGLLAEFKTAEGLLAQAELDAQAGTPSRCERARRLIGTARAVLEGAQAPGTEDLTDQALANMVETIARAYTGATPHVARAYLVRAAQRLQEGRTNAIEIRGVCRECHRSGVPLTPRTERRSSGFDKLDIE